MAFVKLDCGILDSTIWIDKPARDVFITALLMAEPRELTEPMEQLEVLSLNKTGFVVPVGWYGFVEAAGVGIVTRAGVKPEDGMSALIDLGSPEQESRTPDFEGRRLVRVAGGYVVLNFDKYRQKDHTAAERSKRYRERNKAQPSVTVTDKSQKSRVSSRSNGVTGRSVTQAEAEAEGIQNTPVVPLKGTKVSAKGPLQLRAEAIFHRRPDSPLTKAELRAFKNSKAAIEATTEEDWLLLERFYAEPQPETFARKDLATLVNNWNCEIDRARAYEGKSEGNLEPRFKGAF